MEDILSKMANRMNEIMNELPYNGLLQDNDEFNTLFERYNKMRGWVEKGEERAYEQTQCREMMKSLKGPNKTDTKNYMYITISPDNAKVTFEKFKERVESFVGLIFVEEAIWCYDKGDSGLYHTHILIKRKGRVPSYIRNVLLHKFRDVCGSEMNIWTENKVNNPTNIVMYIQGEKTDHKMEAVAKTRDWLDSQSLPYYSTKNWTLV